MGIFSIITLIVMTVVMLIVDNIFALFFLEEAGVKLSNKEDIKELIWVVTLRVISTILMFNIMQTWTDILQELNQFLISL